MRSFVIAGSLLASLFASVSVAHADEATASVSSQTATRAYVSVGAGLSSDTNVNGVVAVEGGMRLKVLYPHVTLVGGRAARVTDADTHYEVRAGLDFMPCSGSGDACAIIGADVGYMADERDASSSTRDLASALFAPHLGLDVGGKHVRFRVVGELRTFHVEDDTALGVQTRTRIGLGLSTALAYRF